MEGLGQPKARCPRSLLGEGFQGVDQSFTHASKDDDLLPVEGGLCGLNLVILSSHHGFRSIPEHWPSSGHSSWVGVFSPEGGPWRTQSRCGECSHSQGGREEGKRKEYGTKRLRFGI